MTAEPDEAARVAVLAAALEQAVDPSGGSPPPRWPGWPGSPRRTGRCGGSSDLCELAGLGPRTLQRMFLQYAGVSPTWVIRRYRLLEAAESVREGKPVSWAEIAAGLGYADQAHLTRDFRAATGQTPAAYAGAQPSRYRFRAYAGPARGRRRTGAGAG